MSVQQQVLRFEIAVDDVHAMKIIQCQRNLGSVELCYRVGKALMRVLVQAVLDWSCSNE